jgi:hypothetical protein
VLAPAAARASASNDTRARESSGQLPGTGAGVDTAEGTGLGVLLLVGTGTGVRLVDGTGTGVRVADGTGTGALTLVGTGVGVRAPRLPVLEGTGTGVLPLVGTGAGVQSGWAGDGDGDGDADGWRAVGAGEGPAGAGVIAPLRTGTGVVALVGTGAGVVALVGMGVGVAQPGPPAVWWAPAECLPADCAEAESSRAGWPGLADATASPTPPASRAAAGSPSQAIVRVPGVLMLTSSSGRPGWSAVAVGTCGRPVRLHDHRVRYATSASRPDRPELPFGERT